MEMNTQLEWSVLVGNNGKNITAQNYHAYIDISLGDNLSMSSGDLKDVLKDIIMKPLDGAFCYAEDDNKGRKTAEYLKKEANQKIHEIKHHTLAEDMVKYIFEKLNGFFLTHELEASCMRVSLTGGESWDTVYTYSGE